MGDPVYEWYCATRKLIDRAKEKEMPPEIVEQWQESIEAIEISCNGIKERYERNLAVQKSFTYEQIDFICYQIGDWYCEWKHKMATGEGTQHRLGIAKEHLKIRLCGE